MRSSGVTGSFDTNFRQDRTMHPPRNKCRSAPARTRRAGSAGAWCCARCSSSVRRRRVRRRRPGPDAGDASHRRRTLIFAALIQRGSYRVLPLLAAPLALVHRNFIACMGRMADAMTDPLTGLPNQRCLTEHAARELARARRTGSKLSLVVLDLGGFKSINDLEG